MKINGAGGQTEVCRWLADQDGDRVLILSALHHNVCLENMGILQLRASLRYIRFRCSSAFESVFSKPQRSAIGLHRLIEELFFCVGTAQLEIVVCQALQTLRMWPRALGIVLS
jgi:hypothetical protein